MSSDELSRTLSEWSDDARLEAARQQRATQRWNEQVSAETATFTGLLIDLYETSTSVQLQGAHGRKHSGQIVEVGSDFVAVAALERPRVLVPLSCVGSVQVSTDARRLGVISDRPSDGALFADVLGELSAHRMHIRFLTKQSDQVRSGTISSAGADIITVSLDSPTETVFVPIKQITELSVA